MTMRELMTHTGGLGYVLSANNPVDKMIIDANVLNAGAPLQAMIDGLAKTAAARAAGHALVLQHRRRRAGLSGREVLGASRSPTSSARAIFEPLGHEGHRRSTCRRKNSARLAQVHTGSAPALAVDANRPDPAVVPLGASGGGGLFSTAVDYARFCEMLLQGGQLNGVRLLAPRTVEMMRTNHVNPEPLKTMPPGTGWGLDFQVVTDAAAAGDSVSNGTFSWFGIAGTWFWIDPVDDLAFVGMVQHQSLGHHARDPRPLTQSRLPGDRRIATRSLFRRARLPDARDVAGPPVS